MSEARVNYELSAVLFIWIDRGPRTDVRGRAYNPSLRLDRRPFALMLDIPVAAGFRRLTVEPYNITPSKPALSSYMIAQALLSFSDRDHFCWLRLETR